MKYGWITKILNKNGWAQTSDVPYKRRKDAKGDADWHAENGIEAKVERMAIQEEPT